MSSITPKENQILLYSGQVPEYIPSFYEPYADMVMEELLTPSAAPNGPIITTYGVEYVGSKDINNGAMPAPGKVILDDILKWRDVIITPDFSGRDWEGYYKKQSDKFDRVNHLVSIGGGDYFLTLVSFMGFENALLALYEEPEEVKALLEYVSDFYIDVMKKQIYYTKPDCFSLMDDDAAYRAPFFSLGMYREFFKPFHKRHCDLALENSMFIGRHDCGKCEQFIDDWVEMGICHWNPAQVTNDVKAIKKKYLGKLALFGCWDNQGEFNNPNMDNKRLLDAMVEYVDYFAPGGGFSFMATVSGNDKMSNYTEKVELIKKFYYDYVKDWYKHHC